MAITNYIRPQLTIAQLLAELPSASSDRLTPLIVGPQYLLSRYGKESSVYSEPFDTAGMELPYKYKVGTVNTALPSGYVVDQDSVKLHGVKLEAQLAEFLVDDDLFKIQSTTAASVIRIKSGYVKGSGRHATFLGRDVKLGDIVYVYADDSTSSYKKRKVIGFRGAVVASSKGNATNSAYNPATDATADSSVSLAAPLGWTITTSGTPDFNVRGGSVVGTKLSEEFTILVRTSGAPATATVDISSKSGDFKATDVATVSDGGTGFDITDDNADGELGGVDINLDQGGDNLVAGQLFKVRVYQAYERLNDGNTDQITVSGTYTGTKNTTYLLTVKTGTAVGGDTATDAVLTISDTAGIDEPTEVTIEDNTNFYVGTYGLSAKISLATNTLAQGGLRAGDVYAIVATAEAESTSNFDGIVLDGPAVDTTVFVNASTPIKVQFRVAHIGEIKRDASVSDEAWTSDTTKITLASACALYISDRSSGNEWVPFVDGVGAIHVSFRALVPAPASEDRISIFDSSDILEHLGSIDLDNDLAFGVAEALSGIQGAKKVFALRTNGSDMSAFVAALRKVESTDSLYAIVPLTDDLDIQKAVVSHCDTMSAPTKKNFRRCYVATDSPGSYAVLTNDSNGDACLATIGDLEGANVLLSTEADVDFTELGLETGDLVKLTTTDTTYKIKTIISATEIELEAGPDDPVSPAVPFELWRADTPSSQRDYVIARSKALSNRRCINVWIHNGKRLINDVLTKVPNKFVACEIAGLRCALLPQQGLTNTEIQSVTNAPAMYVQFSQEDLDEIAANGTMIVTQEAENGEVYIRHQLTTESEASKGSLYYEDSVGVNLDTISFKIKDALTGFIGKKNVTARTLTEVRETINSILDSYTKVPINVNYSAALNGYKDLTVSTHPVLKDRIVARVTLLIPLPLNNIEVTLEGDIDLSL